MMKRFTSLILCLLFFSFSLSAQHLDVGIRVNSLIILDESLLDNDINIIAPAADETYRQARFYSYDLFAEAKMTNHVFHRFRIGFQYNFVSTLGKVNFIPDERIIFNKNESDKAYRFGLGIGKVYQFDDKLILKYGGELFAHINTVWHDDNTYDYFDNSGKKTKTINVIKNGPVQIAGGIEVFTGIYYNFWKKISVGIDINNYFQYAQKNGKITTDYEYYDANGSLTSTDTEIDEIKQNSFNTYFLSPSIGLTYRF